MHGERLKSLNISKSTLAKVPPRPADIHIYNMHHLLFKCALSRAPSQQSCFSPHCFPQMTNGGCKGQWVLGTANPEGGLFVGRYPKPLKKAVEQVTQLTFTHQTTQRHGLIAVADFLTSYLQENDDSLHLSRRFVEAGCHDESLHSFSRRWSCSLLLQYFLQYPLPSLKQTACTWKVGIGRLKNNNILYILDIYIYNIMDWLLRILVAWLKSPTWQALCLFRAARPVIDLIVVWSIPNFE